MMQVTVTNASAEKISTIVIQYPEASFGINVLDPGKTFHYKLKPTATGEVKIGFVDARGASRSFPGPVLHKNDTGTMDITLRQDGGRVATTQ